MGRRVRVILIIHGFEVEMGGAERFGIELGRALGCEELDVEVWALWKMRMSVEEERMCALRQEGVKTFAAAPWNERHPYTSFWQTFQSMRVALADRPADILHCNCVFADVVGLMLKRGLSTPPVVMRTVHDGYRHEWRKHPLLRLVLSDLLYPLMFDFEAGVSPDIVNRLNQRRVARRAGKTAFLIPNAINLARFEGVKPERNEVKRSLGIPQDALVVGTVGRLSKEKNYGGLLEAAADVLRQLPEVYFLIVGGGNLADSLKDYAKRLNITPRVVFTGPRADVERMYAAMDLFVSSSLWEGTSTTILESMASSVPVIATQIPGTRSLVQDKTNGRLVPPADSTALAHAIVGTLGSPMQREELARRARETAQAYSIEKIAAEYRAIYSAAACNRM